MPGINQLGGALAVSTVQKAATTVENSNAAVAPKADNVQKVSRDAVQGVRASKSSARTSADQSAVEGRRRSRQFSDLAKRSKAKRADREASAEERKAQSRARSEANDELRQKSKARLEQALNGKDLFSPRPRARQD